MINLGKRTTMRKKCKKKITHVTPSYGHHKLFNLSHMKCDVWDNTEFTTDDYMLCDYCARELRLVW